MTDALALLDGASSVLRAAAPSLPGDGRYTALLAANAIATARRDIGLAHHADAARAAISTDVTEIRAGLHDDDAVLHERLVAYAVIHAWIADPGSVTEAERTAWMEALD